jgi:hypothetical protein
VDLLLVQGLGFQQSASESLQLVTVLAQQADRFAVTFLDDAATSASISSDVASL